MNTRPRNPKPKSYPQVQTAFTFMMKKRRQQKKMSFKKLGLIVGMSRSYVSDIEAGLYDTSMEIGFCLCEVLEIELELFIDHMYQVKQIRVITDIERSCHEWGIDVPKQFQHDQFFSPKAKEVLS